MPNSQNHQPTSLDPTLSIGQCATLACLLEATAPKPGNVHRGADFDDMTFTDFVVSATAIGPVMDAAMSNGVGETVFQSVRATRQMVDVNTNLGTALLLAPLACVPREMSLESGITEVLGSLTADDARKVYKAIRLAEPGGLGEVDQMDVADDAPSDLLAAMRSAGDRDMVARQYADYFQHVLRFVAPALCNGTQAGWSLTDTIIHTHVRLLAQFPDGLIARKCGSEIAQQAAARATTVLEAGKPGDERYLQALGDLDFWLRSDGHRRNPGTTADLVAAGLFVVLRDGMISGPLQ